MNDRTTGKVNHHTTTTLALDKLYESSCIFTNLSLVRRPCLAYIGWGILQRVAIWWAWCCIGLRCTRGIAKLSLSLSKQCGGLRWLPSCTNVILCPTLPYIVLHCPTLPYGPTCVSMVVNICCISRDLKPACIAVYDIDRIVSLRMTGHVWSVEYVEINYFGYLWINSMKSSHVHQANVILCTRPPPAS